MKCPYCARNVPKGNLKCRACRRFVLAWPHYLVLTLLSLFFALALIELFLSFS
ncbi:MAG TPA: hypothetical protein VER32_14830 [Pyrinomonadaceae bacterium]|nr:hypothetical protein [Pyrinomonadaceae bacterium]